MVNIILITQNTIHDLKIIKNTPGGDDDYGAVGIVLSGPNNEISYNKISNCIDMSYDYGVDGGAIEWWGNAYNNFVHHNWASDNNGFLEIGGSNATDSSVIYNVSVNNGRFSTIHLEGPFKSIVENFRIDNNTIVEKRENANGWMVINFDGTPDLNTLILRNNIFYIVGFNAISNEQTFTHLYNLFYLENGTRLGFILEKGEIIGDPRFSDLKKNDFHLKMESPAIDAGFDLGYGLDFDNQFVPSGNDPDLSAFEYFPENN